MPKHLLSMTAECDQTILPLLRQHTRHFIPPPTPPPSPPPRQPRRTPQLSMQRGTSDISLICRQPDIYAILELIWHQCFICRVKVAEGIKELRLGKTDGGVSVMPPRKGKKQKKLRREDAQMHRGTATYNSCRLDSFFGGWGCNGWMSSHLGLEQKLGEREGWRQTWFEDKVRPL